MRSVRLLASALVLSLPAGPHTFHGEWHEQGTLVQVRDASVDFMP